MGSWMMGSYGWGLGWFMPLLMVIFWGLVIWGIVALVQYTLRHNTQSSSSSLEMLKTRYAKGEITKAEFDEKKKDLI